jgi:maltose alpha-D-glucosyltransferase/alpha-amylase
MNAPLTSPLPLSPTAAIEEDRLWYKDAIIYQLHVKSFFDANNDGVGDFLGLLSKLDYIAALGVTAIWLLPFYPSPRRDDGYDISGYRAVHPDYGHLSDVKRLVSAAHERGLRVITELVINHTSDQHPWFQRARRAKPGSVHRDYYVWSADDHKYAGTRIIFIDTQRSNWTWDEEAGVYYWHRFYSHQPDLNFDNPRVLREVLSVMRYWLAMGVDGLRLDAVPYLVEREGTNNENLPETHAVLKQIRAAVDASFPDRMLLAEANQWPEDTKEYFGDGDECHMAFHFPLMPRMYMAIAREDRFPITDILRQTPDIPHSCQWAIFLRNHDELTLEMVTNSERDYLWETYAADRRARLNLGIRRRLAPLLERDRRRIELMNYLLLSMPGTPVIYYGDEIGMGDNIHLGDRDGVRTPMQWSPDRNGGFSRADPSSLVLPTIMDPLYGYEAVNVEAQSRDPHSLLNWMRRVLAVRRQHRSFGRGTFRLLYPKNRKILAYLRSYQDEILLCVANLARTPQAVELDLSEFSGRFPIELGGGSVFPPVGQLTYLLTLPPYGFYWFILAREAEWPSLHTPAPEPMPEYQTLVMRRSLVEALNTAHATVERDILPAYIAKRRWFSAKDQELGSVRIALSSPLPDADRDILLAEVETMLPGGAARWLLPLSVYWEDEPNAALTTQLALARVRRGSRVGLLTDGFAVPSFVQAVVTGFSEARRIATEDGEIRFEPTELMQNISIARDAAINWLSAEQSNSSLIVGDAAMLKIFRRVVGGPHPEAEMGRYLTEKGYSGIPPLLGEMVRVGSDGTRHTLAVAQGFVRNQGDGWNWTLEWLTRSLSDLDADGDLDATPEERFADYENIASLLGRRLAEMHAVLALDTDDSAFSPEQATEATARRWAEQVAAQLEAAFAAISAQTSWEPPADEVAAKLQSLRGSLIAALPALARQGIDTMITRVHGDLHLGQTLVASGNIFLIDFEGEPARSLDERRAKASPFKDVAGVLRSFDYAAAMMQRKSRESHAHLPDATREAFLASFIQRADAAFLNGYRAVAGTDLDTRSGLLDLLLIEKAAYEIVYEAANRPGWIDVPLRGLARLADRLTQETKQAADD